jgi:hypothetical protein
VGRPVPADEITRYLRGRAAPLELAQRRIAQRRIARRGIA